MRNRRTFSGTVCCLALFAAMLSAVAATGTYHIIKRIPIPGGVRWDYVTADTEGRRLYVSHDTEVVVLDLDSGATVGKITGASDMHGTVVVRDAGRGFISASDPGSIVIFDLKTLAVTGKVRVGDDPNGIIYDRKTQRIFSADRRSKRVTSLDAKTGRVAGSIDNLGGKTEHLVSDDAGHIFLNMQDLNTLLRLDSVGLNVLNIWPLNPCGLPSSMDMDRAHQRVFIGCRSGVMAVVDANTGKLITTQPIDKGVDATEFDSATGLVYFSTGEGVLSVFHQDSPDSYSLVQSVTTLTGARTMALDHKTGNVYLPVADFGRLPEAAPGQPQPRAPAIPGTFSVLVVGR